MAGVVFRFKLRKTDMLQEEGREITGSGSLLYVRCAGGVLRTVHASPLAITGEIKTPANELLIVFSQPPLISSQP